jgi:hypothetical protein
MKALSDPRVKQFCELVNKGIEAWTEAGQVLCNITRDNPGAYTDILSDNPHLTRDVLESFERIGRREIYPYLLVDGSPGCRRLAALPYDSQVKLFNSRVAVAVKTRGGIEERRKRVCELSNPEAALVFDATHLRSFHEQAKILRESKRSIVVVRNASSRNGALLEPEEPESTVGTASLDAKPDDELKRLLTLANDALLEARTVLSTIKRGSRKDSHITAALLEIGSLRYAVNEGEL